MTSRWLLLVTIWSSSMLAVARADTPLVHLEYAGAPACPSADVFAAEVRERLPNVRFSTEATPVPAELQVSVELHGGSEPSGVVRLTRQSRPEQPRMVHGHTCEEVVRGLALITALVIEPRPEAALTATTATTPSAPAAEPRGPLPAAPPSAPAPMLTAPRPTNPPAGAWWIGPTVHVATTTLFEPGPTWNIDAGLEWGTQWKSWGAMLRVLGSVGVMGDAEVVGAKAEFSRWSVGSEVCPLFYGLDARASVRLCERMDIGQLSARGVQAGSVLVARNEKLTTLHLREAVWFRYLLGAAHVEAGLALVHALRPFDFAFHNIEASGSSVRIAQERAVGAEISMGAGLRFF